eukprot:TRINITY_DN3905_c0_g1_i1.p1 TRINITY_DN3905_c0_g1~~TRINITY_DN3905_c0_g1_i1.p1  ORF type:complete len:358 (+),score=80.35 TRINITY_DN3905_c0_g1_i1:88-1161(+)
MIRRPPRSTLSSSSAASDVYKRQVSTQSTGRNFGANMKSFLVLVSLVCVSASQPPFLVMGDWGGQSDPPYTTGAEVNTAAGMGAIASKLGAKLAVVLGDNFYGDGVPSVDSPRFKTTFEDVFTAPVLQHDAGFRFQLIGGNHDHMQNITAQVAYSQVSPRWVFPDIYYTFTEGDVQFIMIDTVVLSGNSQTVDGGDLAGNELPGPADAAMAATQYEWIEAQLKASQAKYLLVAGHYPMYSICEHGPTEQLIDQLKPLLIKYNVSSYINGHDHCAEHVDVGDGVQYHTIGSAHVNDPSTAHNTTLEKSQLKFHMGTGKAGPQSGGFASVEVTDDGLVVTHRDGDGTVLYTAPAIPARV